MTCFFCIMIPVKYKAAEIYTFHFPDSPSQGSVKLNESVT